LTNNADVAQKSNMQARLILRQRVILSAGVFKELVLWRVPAPLAGSAHDFKYRMALVVNGACVLRYDNEAGKGDHFHGPAGEVPFVFTGIEALLNDFDGRIREYLDGNADHR